MTCMSRRSFAVLGASALSMGLAAVSAQAQEAWPAKGKPVNVIVSAGAGSGQDVTARILTEQLQKEFPGSVFQIVNRPGAGTQIGTQAIADAAPDGYTFGVIALPTAVTLHLDPARQARFTGASFEPAANFIYDPGALAVPADSKYRNLADLVADAKARPGAWRALCLSSSSAVLTSGRSRKRRSPRRRTGTAAVRSASSKSADWAFVRYSTAICDHGTPLRLAATQSRATPAASAASSANTCTSAAGPSARGVRTDARSPVMGLGSTARAAATTCGVER